MLFLHGTDTSRLTEPVEHRHLNVRQNQIKMLTLTCFHSLLSVFGLHDDRLRFVFQRMSHQFQDRNSIVHDKDLFASKYATAATTTPSITITISSITNNTATATPSTRLDAAYVIAFVCSNCKNLYIYN